MIQYLSALILHIQRRAEGGRGAVISVKIRHICGEDRRCSRAVRMLMTELVEKGLATQYKRVFLIEKKAVEEVLEILKKQCGGCPLGYNRLSFINTRRRRGGVWRAAE